MIVEFMISTPQDDEVSSEGAWPVGNEVQVVRHACYTVIDHRSL